MSKQRLTTHNGRIKGANASHNDRHIEPKKNAHIDQERTPNNIYFLNNRVFTHEELQKENISLNELEKKIYKNLYTEYIQERKEICKNNRHKDRIPTVEKLLASKKHMPQETIMQIGNMEQQTVVAEVLKELLLQFVEWHRKEFPLCHIMDIAIHTDEASLHAHIRKTFYTVSNSMPPVRKPEQEKSLEQMGVPLPNPTKPVGRYNNRMMTYSKMCREKMLEICKQHGLEIETEPIKDELHNLKKEQYIKNQLEREIAKLEAKKEILEMMNELDLEAIEKEAVEKVRAKQKAKAKEKSGRTR